MNEVDIKNSIQLNWGPLRIYENALWIMQCTKNLSTNYEQNGGYRLHRSVITSLDGIIVYSGSEEQHEKDLKVVFGRLRIASVTLNKKCKFYRAEL